MSHDHHMHHNMAQEGVTPSTSAPVHIHEEHDHGDGDMSHMMKMYFHTDLGLDYVFFKSWQPKTAGDMIWTCIIIAILAILYEGLKYYREYLLRASRISTYYISSDLPNGVRPPNGNGNPTRAASRNELRRRMLSSSHIVQTFLHLVQFLISYLLMLVFMTYNIYLCISVLIGATIGYFLFGWYKSFAVDITEHCH